jgi:hypothetical protein
MTHAPQRRPQISLALLLLLMVIFAVMSAGMFYASRVGAVQDELSLLSGSSTRGAGEANRTAHLVFLLFTYTSPLLLAMALSGVVALLRYRQRPAVRS